MRGYHLIINLNTPAKVQILDKAEMKVSVLPE